MTGSLKGERRLPLDINTTRAEGLGELPALAAYAFSSGGTLLDQQAIDAKGNAQLSLPVGTEAEAVRVVIGPIIDKDELTVAELLRRGGLDKHIAVRPNLEKLAPLLVDIAPDLARHWLGRHCLVKGTLIKRVSSGGFRRDLPVCNAAIDIYEVDAWSLILPRLPLLEIDRLRDILDGPWPPLRLPTPPRPPDFVFDDLLSDGVDIRSLNPQPLPPRAMLRSRRNVTVTRSSTPSVLPADLQLAARLARPALERAVLANVELLRPILCWLYPHFVTKQKIATVMTDECGHFRTTIWRSYFDHDIPDLYFTARQLIWPGFWITIYERTPIACNTHWNYVCGTEVSLITTHPLARTCPPCPPIDAPPNWVLFMAIGNASVWRIHGANTATAVGSVGHDATKRGLLDDTAPWGGTLRPRLEFDSSLRASLGVRYYRVAFKRPAETDLQWRFSTESVNRHYIHTVAGEPVITQYALGPVTAGTTSHLYEIPPALPPVGQWSLPNVVLDSQNAVIPTNAVATGVPFDENGVPTGPDESGLWQIRIELFDAAGTLVDPEALGIAWRIPRSNDLTGTIPTENAANLGLVDATRNCMIVTIHVDNNPCFASIAAPTLDGNPASSGCGVMTYSALTSTVVTPFTALQRNRFADYSFYVQRGEGPGAQLAASGRAAVSPATMPVAPSSSVGDLLDGCAIAGFTEQLYVAHLAVDGWSRQQQLDAQAVRAFVLAPLSVTSPIATP